MSPKMFRMQVARYSCRSAVMPSKFLHARMSTSRGWPSSHSEISVSVSCAGDRRPGGRGPPRLPQGPPSRAPGPGSGPNKPRQGLGLSSRDTAARVAAGSLPPLWRAARVCAWACVCPPAGTACANVGAGSCRGTAPAGRCRAERRPRDGRSRPQSPAGRRTLRAGCSGRRPVTPRLHRDPASGRENALKTNRGPTSSTTRRPRGPGAQSRGVGRGCPWVPVPRPPPTSTSAVVYTMCTKCRFRAEPPGMCATRRSR